MADPKMILTKLNKKLILVPADEPQTQAPKTINIIPTPEPEVPWDEQDYTA